LLLTGCRLGEGLALTWNNVHLAEYRIEISASTTKTKADRTIELDVCPSVTKLLESMRPAEPGSARVFAPHTDDSVNSARRRLQGDKLTPPFDYQTLRVTAATYLACMPSYGPVLESRQLGHSIVVAEKHYIGRVRVPADVRTLEAALGLETGRRRKRRG
jgi:integrase